MQQLSRREFLKSLGGVLMMGILPTLPAINPDSLVEPQIPIPPSLMLHSQHGKGRFLPEILELISTNGFTTTTYKAWLESVRLGRPIPKPIIISIDDLTLAKDVTYAWQTFAGMKSTLQDFGMVATYGVITTPLVNEMVMRLQDAERWDLMVAWVSEGFELASHTSFHSCFSNKYSAPRADFDQDDYDAEICDSANLIERELANRGISYSVETLILPFGSGYSYMDPEPQVHAGIIRACQKTNIRMIAGIPQGREPFALNQLTSTNEPLYMGRLGPIASAEGSIDIAGTATLLNQWSQGIFQ